MVRERPHWFDDCENTAVRRGADEVRRLSAREGWCYHHVQAIQVSIDQYAEAALGNREFFLNRRYSIAPGHRCCPR